MNSRHLPFIAFLTLALGLWAAMTYEPDIAVPVASPLPPLILESVDGKTLAPQWKPEPGKVALINFFASWCVPCLAEHPQLKSLATIDGIALHGIAWNDDPVRLTAWLAKHGNPFTDVWRDVSGRAAISMGLRGVPESFVVDKRGMLRLHIQGAIDTATAKKLAALLIQLRDEPARSEHAPAL